jgi:hypothetical protein
MRQTTIKAISECNTLKEYLSALQNNFQVENCKPGKLIKTTLIYSIVSKLDPGYKISETTKNMAVNSQNMKEFIDLIDENFNNVKFTDSVKNQLLHNTQMFCGLLNLKENEEKPVMKQPETPPAKPTLKEKVKNKFKRK